LNDLDDLLNHAPCGFLSFGDDGAIETINATLLHTLGYQREEMVGRRVEQLFAASARSTCQLHWLPLLRRHGHAEEILLTLCRKSGEEIAMLSYAQRRATGAGYDCVVVEVREPAHAHDELARTMSSFLALMSHELRTPLNAIGGYLQLLELEIAGPLTAQQHEILQRVDRSSQRLLGLVNDVLDLSRIEAGSIDYDVRDVLLIAAVTPAVAGVKPLLAEKHIHLAVHVPRGAVVRADQDKLGQIIGNLLGNAAKFTQPGGRVEVFVDETATVAEVHVRDTGTGIPADQLESIFHPFVQLDSVFTRSAEGSGLGLAISRDLARGMGGDVTVASAMGKGSTFTCRIPTRRYRSGSITTPAPRLAPAAESSLVIE
jgi:PAS domain S-box-containing protein